MTSLLPKQLERAVDFLKKSEPANCFVFKGLLIRGDAFDVVKAFVKSDSNEKFTDWVERQNLVIIKGFNNKLKTVIR